MYSSGIPNVLEIEYENETNLLTGQRTDAGWF